MMIDELLQRHCSKLALLFFIEAKSIQPKKFQTTWPFSRPTVVFYLLILCFFIFFWHLVNVSVHNDIAQKNKDYSWTITSWNEWTKDCQLHVAFWASIWVSIQIELNLYICIPKPHMKTETEQLLFVCNSPLSILGDEGKVISYALTNIEHSSPVAIDFTGQTIKQKSSLPSTDIEGLK